jgi:hypothetical protein
MMEREIHRKREKERERERKGEEERGAENSEMCACASMLVKGDLSMP